MLYNFYYTTPREIMLVQQEPKQYQNIMATTFLENE